MQMLLLAENHDTLLGVNVPALSPRDPKALQRGPVTSLVHIAQNVFAVMAGDLDGVVEGHLGEEVVHDMRVVDVVDPPVEDRPEVAVNCS